MKDICVLFIMINCLLIKNFQKKMGQSQFIIKTSRALLLKCTNNIEFCTNKTALQFQTKLRFQDTLSEIILFFFFVFYLGCLSLTFTNHRTAGERGGHFFNSSLPLPPASQTLRHQPGNYCRELTFAHSQQLDSNREPLVSERKLLTTKLRTSCLSWFCYIYHGSACLSWFWLS